MAHLYFMDREFAGKCLVLDTAIESANVRLLFEDSWYWLHYEFFGCRDAIASESTAALRTHLHNLVALIYRGFDKFLKESRLTEEELHAIIRELLEIVEYSRSFEIALWTYGDTSSREELHDEIERLPTNDEIVHLMNLPHLRRTERERLHYRFVDETVALKRYRREHADYNKRSKLEKRTTQNGPNRAEQAVPPKSDRAGG